jgi:hypothetical protein
MLTALTATLFLGLAVTTTTAGRLSTSSTKFRATWNRITFLGSGSGISLTCRLTLEGSFHSGTIRKVPGSLIGAVTRGIIDSANCRGTNEPSSATVLQETLPWHVTHESFGGTLPNITEITFLSRRFAFQHSATILGTTVFCLYADQGRPEENFRGTINRNTGTGAVTTETPPIGEVRLLRGAPLPELCPPYGSIGGLGEVFSLGNTTRITVTLI